MAMDPGSERRFFAAMVGRNLVMIRLACVLGALSMLAYGLWDMALDPAELTRTLPIRLAVAVLFGAATAATWSRRFVELFHVWISGSLLLCVAGYTAIMTLLADGFLYGVGGLMLALIILPAVVPTARSMLPSLAAMLLLPNLAMALAGTGRRAFLNFDAFIGPAVVMAFVVATVLERSRRRAFRLAEELEAETAKTEALLSSILPASVVSRLKSGQQRIADQRREASIVFADIVGFTGMTVRLSPEALVELLNETFSRLDGLLRDCGLDKVKTIGDSYMAGAGLTGPVADGALRAARFAVAARALLAGTAAPLSLRFGIATGPVICGVIGAERPHFDAWGGTVNLASRLEATAPPDGIQVDAATAERIARAYRLAPRGPIELKGVGIVPTYLIEGAAR
jgi:class 3 adenylate cyclase